MSLTDFLHPLKRLVNAVTPASDTTPPQQQALQQPLIIPPAAHNIREKDISPNALDVMETLHQAGFQALLVGGGVRDLLSNIKPKDFDVATDAHPEQVKKLFRYSYIVGKRFRIVHVRYRRETIEVSTFRSAAATSHRPRTFSQQYRKKGFTHNNTYGTQAQDALGRDLTINACYYDKQTGNIIDYTGGVADIKQREIRLIGKPEERYKEDPVRMMRVIRFWAKLGFTPHKDTLTPIASYKHLLKTVPKARLLLETVKLFYTGCAQQALARSREQGIFELLFPHTEAIINNPKNTLQLTFLEQACCNTDKRYADDLPLNTGFLFAVMLWPVLSTAVSKAMAHQQKTKKGTRSPDAQLTALLNQVDKHTANTLKQHTQHMDLPQYIARQAAEIWRLQYHFQHLASHKKMLTRLRLVREPLFKAAYDFLLLRAQAGEKSIKTTANTWKQVYNSPRAQKILVKQPRKRRPPTRKKQGHNNQQQNQ